MNPAIFDDRGKEVLSVAGPYEEGSELKLLCMVSGNWHSETLHNSHTETQWKTPS